MADITIDMTKYIVSTSSVVGSDKNNEVTSELIVTTSDTNDAGMYTCQANNSVLNTSMDSVEVVVQCKLCNILNLIQCEMCYQRVRWYSLWMVYVLYTVL